MSAHKDELDDVGASKGMGKKNIIIMVVAALVLVGASVGVTMMMLGKSDHEAATTKDKHGEKGGKKKAKDAEAAADEGEAKHEKEADAGNDTKGDEHKSEGDAKEDKKADAEEEHGDSDHADEKHAAKDSEAGDQEEDDDEEGDEEEAHQQFYVEFAPAFVVNLPSKDKEARSRFLKVEVSGVSKEAKIEEEVKKHMPALRNALVMLFSKQVYEDLISAAGKEKLRKVALQNVQKAMKKATGKKLIKDLYFTSFVMQ